MSTSTDPSGPPDVGTPSEARELDEELYYASLTQRNRGLIPAALQEQIRHTPCSSRDAAPSAAPPCSPWAAWGTGTSSSRTSAPTS